MSGQFSDNDQSYAYSGYRAGARQQDATLLQIAAYGKERFTDTNPHEGKWGGIYAIADSVVDLVSTELPGMLPWRGDMTSISLTAGQYLPGPFTKVTVQGEGDIAMVDWGPQQ